MTSTLLTGVVALVLAVQTVDTRACSPQTPTTPTPEAPAPPTGGRFTTADGVRFIAETVVTNLEIPWSMAFSPDGRLFVTERPGRVRIIDTATRGSELALTLDDVARIAHLARIEIDADAARDVHAKLDAIFALINALQAIDTTGVEPMSHAQDVSLPLRDDAATETDRHAEYQSVAPAVADGLYLVPRVIE